MINFSSRTETERPEDYEHQPDDNTESRRSETKYEACLRDDDEVAARPRDDDDDAGELGVRPRDDGEVAIAPLNDEEDNRSSFS